MAYRDGKRESRSSQHTPYSPTEQTLFFNRSGLTENDKTVVTVHGSLSYSSASIAGPLVGLLDPGNEGMRHLLYLISHSTLIRHMLTFKHPEATKP